MSSAQFLAYFVPCVIEEENDLLCPSSQHIFLPNVGSFTEILLSSAGCLPSILNSYTEFLPQVVSHVFCLPPNYRKDVLPPTGN